MSPVALGFTVLGLLFVIVGSALALALGDRFLGVAVLVIGAFLIVLPYTRPHLDE